MQKWTKLGKLFQTDRQFPWMTTHAAVPFADHINGDHFRIYFSARDPENRSHTASLTIDLQSPGNIKIIALNPIPVIKPGDLGTFDDSGAMGTCLLNHDGQKYLYYIGWNLGVSVPFRNAIGLTISRDGGENFHKKFLGPVMDRTKDEPHFVASNCVIYDQGLFRIWYLSCVGWKIISGSPRHYYHIKYAQSKNGIDWERHGEIAIDFKDEGEYAISVPRVIKEDGIYKMWYSYRGDHYRIGYAESPDGHTWERMDSEIDHLPSASGWDSQMVCYPYIFDHNGERYMLYNGNGYGKTGFGIAVLEE